MKTGEGEQQGENEAQRAGRGRRRKGKTDRGRSQLLRLRTRSSCLEGRVISLQGIHLALRLPPVWGLPHNPNSLSAVLTRMSPPATLRLFTRLSHEHENSRMFIPDEHHSSARQIMYWLINNSPHWFHPDMSNRQCAGGSYECSLPNTTSSITENAANSFCFCFFEINNMSLRPRHGKRWRLFSVSKGWTCLWLPLQ